MARKPKPVEREYIPAKDLVALLRKCHSAKENTDEINEGVREKVNAAALHKNLNKAAFAIIKRYFKKEPEVVGAFYDHLVRYWEDSGLLKRGESAPALEFEPSSDDGKVVRLKSGEDTKVG